MLFYTVILAFALLFLFLYKSYEGFNVDYPQEKYVPYTDLPIPTAQDGTLYISPDSNGSCPIGFERDNYTNSLCHKKCKEGKFYVENESVYGCIPINIDYPQENYDSNYPFAEDKKTYIVSHKNAKCPDNFVLDTTSGLCHTVCPTGQSFYGKYGCVKLNTNYSQTTYDGSNNVYPISEDGYTTFVSPTSTAKCPEGENFVLDYQSGLCHTKCESGIFNGKRSGSSIIGCT